MWTQGTLTGLRSSNMFLGRLVAAVEGVGWSCMSLCHCALGGSMVFCSYTASSSYSLLFRLYSQLLAALPLQGSWCQHLAEGSPLTGGSSSARTFSLKRLLLEGGSALMHLSGQDFWWLLRAIWDPWLAGPSPSPSSDAWLWDSLLESFRPRDCPCQLQPTVLCSET